MNIKELLSTGCYQFRVYRDPAVGRTVLVLQKKVDKQWFDVKPEELMEFSV